MLVRKIYSWFSLPRSYTIEHYETDQYLRWTNDMNGGNIINFSIILKKILYSELVSHCCFIEYA